MNPNNCTTCEHKQNPDGGHCYMYRTPPSVKCLSHTSQSERSQAYRLAQARSLAERFKDTTWVKYR